MAILTWDDTGKRFYENGVDHGVLYLPTNGQYTKGYAWNGLTTVTEAPSGAEPNPQYADNIKYLSLTSAEEFGATIEAFTYPDEFAECDGTASPAPGVSVGQQPRKSFGLVYRTKIGNDVNEDLGYKLHLVYGAKANPSEKAYATVNDSPEAITFSWELTTTPVAVSGKKPTAILTVDSTKVPQSNLAALEAVLFGSAGADPRLPLPDEVIGMLAGSLTEVTPTTPTYTPASRSIALPSVTGVVWYVDGVPKTGTVTHAAGSKAVVKAVPNTGYKFPPIVQDTWVYPTQ